jgi:hypothetical protein
MTISAPLLSTDGGGVGVAATLWSVRRSTSVPERRRPRNIAKHRRQPILKKMNASWEKNKIIKPKLSD